MVLRHARAGNVVDLQHRLMLDELPGRRSRLLASAMELGTPKAIEGWSRRLQRLSARPLDVWKGRLEMSQKGVAVLLHSSLENHDILVEHGILQ